jgi:hypothetical protein
MAQYQFDDFRHHPATPPIFKAAETLAAMQREALRRLLEHGTVAQA